MFEAKLKKWGNSYGIIVPKDEAMKLKENASVYVSLNQFKTARELGVIGIAKGVKLTGKDFLKFKKKYLMD